MRQEQKQTIIYKPVETEKIDKEEIIKKVTARVIAVHNAQNKLREKHYCEYCGTIIKEGDTFCMACGAGKAKDK